MSPSRSYTLPVARVINLANAIGALSHRAEFQQALKLSLTGQLVLAWNLAELNHYAVPVHERIEKLRKEVMSKEPPDPQLVADFDEEVADALAREVDVKLLPLDPEDILSTDGTPGLVGILSVLMRTIIFLPENGDMVVLEPAAAAAVAVA